MPKAPPLHPDHNLVRNRGYYWVCCSINATKATKEKLSFALNTKSVELARHRRDVFLRGIQEAGLELRLRRRPAHTLPPLDRADRVVPWETVVQEVLERARASEPKPASRRSRQRELVPA